MTPYDHVLAVRLAMTSEPIAVAVARAVLVAMGQEKYAEDIFESGGVPAYSDPLPHEHRRQLLRAFCAGHVAAGHDARIAGWPSAIHCEDCISKMIPVNPSSS